MKKERNNDLNVSADVSRETAVMIEKVESLIMQWNGAINLTGARSKTELHHKHGSDAVALGNLLQKLAPEGIRSIYDLGSGNGMPALILSIMTPDVKVHMIEADTRKCAFLREAVVQLKLNAEVIHKRAERCTIPEKSVITACAFKDCKTIIQLAMKISPDPILFLLKGAKAKEEVKEAAEAFSFENNVYPMDGGGSIVHIRNIKPLKNADHTAP